MGKYFGTDGIRGVANGDTLNCELAFSVGRAAASVLGENKPGRIKVLIGKDTRVSSNMLEAAIAAGLASAGADVCLLGVAPTPAVAYLTVSLGADAGVVISASHNPFDDNGIKIFNSQGYKLSDSLEARIEQIIAEKLPVNSPTGRELGTITRSESDTDDYIRHIINSCAGIKLNQRILVDCANGAASVTAARIFGGLGIGADYIFNEPDGYNINAGCGSTHMDELRKRVVAGKYGLGIAFDGDADRCQLVDEKGSDVDGDTIMGVLAKNLKNQGKLKNDTLVATVYSNLGLLTYAKGLGISVPTVAAGDRNVIEEMLRGGYVLGGEQSGHIILSDYATTGDGQLTAVQMLGVLSESGLTLSELTAEIPCFPQVLTGVRTPDARAKESAAASPEVKAAVEKAERELGDGGRVLVRPSGTENLIRVMVEAKDEKTANDIAQDIVKALKTVCE